MTHTGKHCETPLLPACDIGGSFSIPIRSWLLHAFHDGAANQRWPPSGASTAIGPVPCDCLRQFVTAPFMLERTRLRYMRSFTPRCIDLPGGVSLEQFLAHPDGYRDRWRGFSLAAAHDALRLGAEPSMRGAPLDADASGAAELSALIEQLDVWIAKGRKVRNTRPAGYEISTLRARLPPLVLPSSAAPLPLLPLSRCDGRCGGIGWCEDALATLGRTSRTGITGHGSTAPRCGCFSPHGLKSPPGLHTPYGRCNDPTAWRADRQPSPHWGPSCMLNCSGRGSCDWQGFCRCEPGFYGIDCALTRDSASGEAVVVPTSLEARAAAKELRSGAPRPLTPLAGMLDGDDGLVGADYRRLRRRAGSRARGGGDTDGSVQGSDGRGGRHRDGRRAPLYYVVETPPLLRFGVDFAGHVEHSMTERMLRSSHRAATPEAAHYLWYPGAPLVIDGHRLLARLWHVCTEWLGTSPERMLISDGGNLNASFVGVGAKPRLPLVLMPLLTERASMDSFQLSYADEDREEWPGLVHAPHVRAIRELAPGCTEPAPAPRGVAAEAIDAAVDDAAGNSRRQGGRIGGRRPHRGPPISAISLAALEGRLERRLLERRARLGRATLYSLFRGGGYDSFRAARRTCPLPASILPWSPQRVWAGLQFSGNPRNPVFFQRGKDVVIPQMLMIRGVGSHADQPTCEQMKRSSPLSAFFERDATSKRRTTLLWFGGHSGHGDARSAMFRLHQNRKGFVLVDSLRHAAKRLDAINMSLSSAFCWVPRGQGQGCGRPQRAPSLAARNFALSLARMSSFPILSQVALPGTLPGSTSPLCLSLLPTEQHRQGPHTSHGGDLPRLRARLHFGPFRRRRRAAV